MYQAQHSNEFGEQRNAVLFKSGSYGSNSSPLDVRVGYYTQVAGLGLKPDDVTITGAVRTQDRTPSDSSHPDHGPGALDNFWRFAENLAVVPTLGSIDYPNAMPKDLNGLGGITSGAIAPYSRKSQFAFI